MKAIFILLLLIFSLFPASAETIIYDNITTSNYKFLKITDDSNIKLLNEYRYEVIINGNYYGSFNKDEIIRVPDNSNITILMTSENLEINTKLYTRIKENAILIVGIIISISAIIFLFSIVIKLWRKR